MDFERVGQYSVFWGVKVINENMTYMLAVNTFPQNGMLVRHIHLFKDFSKGASIILRWNVFFVLVHLFLLDDFLRIALSFIFKKLFAFVYLVNLLFSEDFLYVGSSFSHGWFFCFAHWHWDFMLIWICSASTFSVVLQFFNESEMKFF